jgi:hypothetical protein
MGTWMVEPCIEPPCPYKVRLVLATNRDGSRKFSKQFDRLWANPAKNFSSNPIVSLQNFKQK